MTEVMGKDNSFEEPAKKMLHRINQLGFELNEVQWWNPVPDVWSVHIQDNKLPFIESYGKSTSKQKAHLDALSQIISRLSTQYFFKDLFLSDAVNELDFVHDPDERWFQFTDNDIPAGLLDEATLSHYDLDEELTASMLVDANSGDAQRGICSLPFTCLRSQKTVWFPVNIISNLYEFNGVASGNSVYEARVEALSGIFERHIKNTILTSGISLPRIPDEAISQFPEVLNAINVLKDKGLVIYVMDASLGGKFPLVCLVAINPDNNGCVASFGAHPKFSVALERSVTGLLAGREISYFDHLPPLTFKFSQVAEQSNLEAHLLRSDGVVPWDLISEDADYTFSEWNIEGTAQEEFEHLCYLIHKVDMDIYIKDYDHLGVQCCRIIVPGMSEIYPVEKLVEENNNRGLVIRELTSNLHEIDEDRASLLLSQLSQMALNPHTRLTDLIGEHPQGQSFPKGFTVVELGCLLCLYLKDYKGAFDMCSKIDMTTLPNQRKTTYLCLGNILKVQLNRSHNVDEFSKVWADMYGLDCLEHCLSLVNGQEIFSLLSPLEAGTESDLLAAVYKQLQVGRR